MCGQVSNNEYATSNHQTRLNVEFADLTATCNIGPLGQLVIKFDIILAHDMIAHQKRTSRQAEFRHDVLVYNNFYAAFSCPGLLMF